MQIKSVLKKILALSFVLTSGLLFAAGYNFNETDLGGNYDTNVVIPASYFQGIVAGDTIRIVTGSSARKSDATWYNVSLKNSNGKEIYEGKIVGGTLYSEWKTIGFAAPEACLRYTVTQSDASAISAGGLTIGGYGLTVKSVELIHFTAGKTAVLNADAATIGFKPNSVSIKKSEIAKANLSNGKITITGLAEGATTLIAQNGSQQCKIPVTVSGSGDVTAKVVKPRQMEFREESVFDAVENLKRGTQLTSVLDPAYWDPNPKDFITLEGWKIYPQDDLEAWEKIWGAPTITKDTIKYYRSLGFTAIRVNVTWGLHMDSETYEIYPMFLDRVQEVVDWCIDAGFYVLINPHNDTGDTTAPNNRPAWLQANEWSYNTFKDKYVSLIEQICERFGGYSEKLIFEAFNEMIDSNEKADDFARWDGNKKAYEYINKWNQLFVDTVRASGGYNAKRNLVCPTYACGASQNIVNGFILPKDTVDNHLMIEFHTYGPYDFWQNSNMKFDKKVQSSIKGEFDRMKKLSQKYNAPVVCGETGAESPFHDENVRAEFAKYVYTLGSKYGFGVCWFDGGFDVTGNHWSITNRKTLQCSQIVINAIMSNIYPTEDNIYTAEDNENKSKAAATKKETSNKKAKENSTNKSNDKNEVSNSGKFSFEIDSKLNFKWKEKPVISVGENGKYVYAVFTSDWSKCLLWHEIQNSSLPDSFDLLKEISAQHPEIKKQSDLPKTMVFRVSYIYGDGSELPIIESQEFSPNGKVNETAKTSKTSKNEKAKENSRTNSSLGISDSAYEKILSSSVLDAGNNYRLKRVLEKIRSGQKVYVACLGGSITEGQGPEDYHDGYAYQFAKKLQDEYAPGKNNIIFNGAGLCGTPSLLGLVRYQSDVVDVLGANPDLLVIEFSVNDDWSLNQRRAFEQLIRNALEVNENAAVIVIHSVTSGGYTSQDDKKTICYHYKIPQVSMKNAINARENSFTVTEKSDYYVDGTHPTAFGYTIMADCLMNIISLADKSAENKKIAVPSKYASDSSFKNFKRILGDDENVKISEGDFNKKDSATQGLFKKNHEGNFPDNWHHAKSTGNKSFNMTVKCKNLVLVYKESYSNDFGKADVYVDGVKKMTLDGNPANGWNNCATLLLIDESKVSEHKIEIKMAKGDEKKAFTIVALGYGI